MNWSFCHPLSPRLGRRPLCKQRRLKRRRRRRRAACALCCLQITLSFWLLSFVAEANFTNSFHLTLQSPVIWSSDKTGLQTSVTADCLRLLTLSTWTQTKPVLNCSVKNKSYLLIYFSLFLAVLSFFCVCVSLFCSSFVGYGRNLLHLICLIIKPLMFVACYFTDFLAVVPCPCISALPRSFQSMWLY